ncbi:MAG: phenylacetate--CoA ligase family protein [Planctomycetota bacterium]
MSYRKHLIMGLLAASGSRIGRNLKEIQTYEDSASTNEIRLRTDDKLKRLLLHAADKVPYYRNVLNDCNVVSGQQVRLENFSKIPILTKEIIRKQGENLYSDDYQQRKPFTNTSGGSTGEPVCFIQDKEYDDWNKATKIYFNAILGKQLGDREIKFWGSDRDILEGTLGIKERVINHLYNRRFFNSYQLGAQQLKELVKLNNRFKPKAYWSYMESALELAKYLSESKAPFESPEIVISTIGPLTEEVKNTIEAGMGCKVYNQYGSREVGVIACQCKEQKGLHIFPWWNHVEIVTQDGKIVESGQGNVAVTTLHNYSMPLIRYEIGDVAVMGNSDCSCGRKTVVLDRVVGRTLGYFKKSDGSLVHSHFIVQALFFHDWIRRFQVIQKELDEITIRIELNDPSSRNQSEIAEIESKTKSLMGQNCSVVFEFVDKIQRSPSGKFVYTECRIS